jgi:hypothetical protein
MQVAGSEGLGIRTLIQAADEPSTVRQLVARCRVSGREVSEVLERAIAHGLMCWDPETGLYRATRLGKERTDAEVTSDSGIHSMV